MIIVSSDETMIINMENIEAIGIGNPLENNEGKFQILANTSSDNQYIIARYKTEERAKEVLQNLIQSYREYRTAEVDGYTNVLEETAVFEMPLE